MSSSRVPCSRCGTTILPVTASHQEGLCGRCWRVPPHRARIRFRDAAGLIGNCFFILFLPLLVPLLFLYRSGQNVWRRLRFPHDLHAIKSAIAEVHDDRHVVRAYVRGVLSGYFRNAPELIGFSQHIAFSAGLNDGGKLRRGEISAPEIPTCKDPLWIESQAGEFIRWLLGS